MDVVSTLLWVAMANTRYPTSTEVSGDKWVEYASWHPKLSFLVDLRNHIPELQVGGKIHSHPAVIHPSNLDPSPEAYFFGAHPGGARL